MPQYPRADPSDRLAYFSAHGVECLAATLCRHRYAPHAHATYVMGAVTRGVGSITVSGRYFEVGLGDLTLYNPHEVHDGAAETAGFSYRVCYPADAVVEDMAEALRGRAAGRAVRFRTPIVRDPRGARLYRVAHQALQRNGSSLRAEELMAAALEHCLVEHAGLAPPPLGTEPRGVARAVDFMHAHLGAVLSLADLVACSGIPRQRLIGAFRSLKGLTPHAYLLNLRIVRARELLRAGQDAAAVARSLGFSDQAHLTRAFKARLGVPPGVFQTAVEND